MQTPSDLYFINRDHTPPMSDARLESKEVHSDINFKQSVLESGRTLKGEVTFEN